MQTAKPGGGGGTTGAQISLGLLHVPMIPPPHVPATVLHTGNPGGEVGGFTTVGAQPLSVSVSGAITSDCAHRALPQSLPAGIGFTEVQAPVHSTGGLKGVDAPVQRDWLLAMIVAGSAQDPAAGSHEQDPHEKGGTVRSA
jgi:hypothetical protein